jgi:hypothetical protein
VHNFILCLKQHSKDQGLESPAGWSNGQWHDPKASENACKYEGVQKKEHPQYLGGRYARCECSRLHCAHFAELYLVCWQTGCVDML